jgi:2-polyprenyl-6-methoxyphenol hydroxylase-like FAD-dependent oxidoreductase
MYCAAQMRKGRMFLVGESVRVHYPASGVGMNFCIQDEFNLDWKLGGVAAGWVQPAALYTC